MTQRLKDDSPARAHASCIVCGACVPPGLRAYCGPDCRRAVVLAKGRERARAAHVPAPLRTFGCPMCTTTVTTRWPGQKFCSRACQRQERQAQKTARARAARATRAVKMCECGLPWLDCRRARPRNNRRSAAWVKFSCARLAEHRALVGDWCPGWRREGHAADVLTVDHVIPISLGGDLFGETQVLCRSCNSRKSHFDGSQAARREALPLTHGYKRSANHARLAAQRAEREAERQAELERRRAEREQLKLARVASLTRTCQVCGAMFVKQTAAAPGLYCSNACKGRGLSEARQRVIGQGERTCPRCHRSFSGSPLAVYCSKTCSKAAQKRRARERARGGPAIKDGVRQITDRKSVV